MSESAQYPWQLLPQLAAAIDDGRDDDAGDRLDQLLQIIARQSGPDLTLRKMRCAQVMSTCMRAARHGGAPGSQLLDEHFSELKQLSAVRSWSSVKRRMHRYLRHLLKAVPRAETDSMKALITAMRRDMQLHLARPRSLRQYAFELEISEGHLSRQFSAIAGHSFSDELQELRCHEARTLLRQTDMPIADISQAVGVASTSQFIADFKRQTGLTPGRFRRQSQASAPA